MSLVGNSLLCAAVAAFRELAFRVHLVGSPVIAQFRSEATRSRVHTPPHSSAHGLTVVAIAAAERDA